MLLQKLKNELGSLGELTVVKCDVAKADDVAAMFEVIKEKHGGVDVCINNAGLCLDAPLLTGNSSDWEAMFNVSISTSNVLVLLALYQL